MEGERAGTEVLAATSRDDRERTEPGPECRNCRTELKGRYCHACGQDAREPPTRALPLLAMLGSHAVGLETKGLRSFVGLVFRPGHLTRSYLEGQRARYSSPVQLYVWCTAAFFFMQSFFPLVRLDPETGSVVSRLTAVSIGTGLSSETLGRLAAEGTSLEVFAERFDAAVTAYFPVLLLGLVGATALLLALQYWKEPALTHIVFALHWCAFYFVLEMVRQLLPALGEWGIPVSVSATLIALAYLGLAMRSVYGRNGIGTATRALVTLVAFASLLGAWLWSTTLVAERLA